MLHLWWSGFLIDTEVTHNDHDHDKHFLFTCYMYYTGFVFFKNHNTHRLYRNIILQTTVNNRIFYIFNFINSD